LLRNSLLELRKGVDVKWSKKSREEWLDISLKQALLVGFLGDFKTGKSYFLSKLADKKNYEHSLTKSTIGLNFIFGPPRQEQKVYFVDSAGSGEPLQIFRDYDIRPRL
jgi:hypothetical protein